MRKAPPDAVDAPTPPATGGHSDAEPTLQSDIAERLVSRYGRDLPAAVIEERVRAVYEQLSTNARITTFLPVLTERAAEAQLIALIETRPPDAGHA